MMLLAALALQAAGAADVVACARQALPAGDLARLQGQMVAEVEGGRKHPDTDAMLRRLVLAAATCQPGADRAVDAAAGRLAVAAVAAEAMRSRLEAAGVDMARVDAVLVDATPAARAGFLAKRFSDPAVAAFSRGVIAAAGTPGRDPLVRRILGAYALNVARLAAEDVAG